MSGARRNGVAPSAPDWAAAHARLDRAEEALRWTGLSGERTEQVLQARARALAHAPERQAAAGRSVLVFGCAGGQYGIDAAQANEIMPLHALTPVPHAAPWVAGVVNRRGEILMLVDVARLMGLAARGVVDVTKVIVVGPPGREVGLLAETVDGIGGVDPAAIGPAPGQAPFVEGVAEGRLVLLDVTKLLAAVASAGAPG